MVSKRREGFRGSRGKNEQKESWRVRSRLRSGRVNSARVALEAVLPQHPSGVAREVQAGGCRKEWIDVKRRGRQKGQKIGEAVEKKEGEGVQGGQGLPSRRESDLEEVWGMEMDLEGEVESRKKLDEQRRKLQKEQRDVEKFSCVPKEFQEGLKSNLQQLQEVEQRRHDLMPEHQKVQ